MVGERYRTFKKSTALYKVHNMGLRYIKYISPTISQANLKMYFIKYTCERHNTLSRVGATERGGGFSGLNEKPDADGQPYLTIPCTSRVSK
jgi:hypothetical protein